MLSYRLLVYGGEHCYTVWRAFLQLLVYGGEHNTLLHRVSL